MLDDYSIWAANPDGTHQKRLTKIPSFASDWSPDGRRIAFDFVDDTGVHIATMDPDGRHVRQLTFAHGIQGQPDWSPDGRWISFESAPNFPEDDPAFHTDLWIMRADGSGARRLTRDGFDTEPVFSPDGRRIAFARITGVEDDFNVTAVYVMNSDGSGLRRIVAPTVGLEHPDWSPDGRLISFNIDPLVPGSSVQVVRPDGTGLRVIRRNDDRFELFKPAWSPDGRKFVVGCYEVRAGIDRVCLMDADGRNLRIVLAPNASLNFPAWGSARPER